MPMAETVDGEGIPSPDCKIFWEITYIDAKNSSPYE
jgi:hypothetical protein